MAELKTRPNDASVEAFLNAIEDEGKRQDAFTLVTLMRKITKSPPQMWGGSIVGFGKYHYKYDSGREGDNMLIGFSPRKANLVFYMDRGFDQFDALLEKLGKYTSGTGCLYVKRLKDIDMDTLKQMIDLSVSHTREAHPS